MAFPRTPLPIGVELYYDGVWNDITADVSDEGIEITRGRSSEGEQVDPSSAKLTLKNPSGKYSPRNPSSALYGKISRNTPIRTWIKHGQVRSLQPSGGAQWQTADKAALDVTGDIDLRVDIHPRTWSPSSASWMGVLKSNAYGLFVDPDGTLIIGWYSGAAFQAAASSRPIPGGFAGRKAIRVTLDVNNGTSGRTATFYYSDTIAGTWIQFSQVIQAGVTTIDASTNALGTYAQDDAEVFGLEVRNGIGGTIVAKVDFTAQANGATSIADGYGNTWAPMNGAECSNKHMRFWGEVVEWPQTWGFKGSRQSVSPIVCAGVLRRIRQGFNPDFSVLRRYLPGVDQLMTYWPLEDSTRSQRIGAYAGSPGRVTGGSPEFAGYSDFAPSKPVMLLKNGKLNFVGKRTVLYSTTVTLTRWMWYAPAGSVPDGTVIMRLRYASGILDIVYATPGGLYCKVYASGMQTVLYTSAIVSLSAAGAGGVDSRQMRLGILTKADGAGKLEMRIEGVCAADPVGYYGPITGLTVNPLGPLREITVNPFGVSLDSAAFGHLTTQGVDADLFDMWAQMKAYAGEDADDRLQRLADENFIELRFDGAGLPTARLDAQQAADVNSLMDEAVETDGGILFEPRTRHDLTYRTLSSIYTQTPVARINYTDNLLTPFEPVDDDRFTRNSVTVTRREGSSVTLDELDGPMSIYDPPDGVGIYESSATLSLASDEDVDDQAGWRLHMGTVDEARWPMIGLDLAHPTLLANAALTRNILAIEIGDRLDVVLLGLTWLPPADVQQIVQGYAETITPFSYRIEFNCTPARPYNAAHYDEIGADQFRYDTAGSTLVSAITTTATSFTVATSSGPMWTTVGADFANLRIVVGGEEMAISSISGASSPQTFTVVRSANGVVKAHSAGADVRLARPTYFGL